MALCHAYTTSDHLLLAYCYYLEDAPAGKYTTPSQWTTPAPTEDIYNTTTDTGHATH
jgi:hypothetical protein